MKKLLLSLLSLSLLVLTACGPATPTTTVPTSTHPHTAPTTTPGDNAVLALEGDTLYSDLQRSAPADISKADQNSLEDSNSEFALDLYQSLKEEEGNLFYSPLSISLALAMTYAGARGETEQQMADTLHFTLEQAKLHQAFNWLDYELAQRGEDAEGKDDEGFRFNIVNAIWGQLGYEFLVDFLDVLAENYGAGLRGLDFKNQPEESRITINDWVSQQTESRIEDLIPQGAIDDLTRLVLTNAIYFNAAWQYPFEEENTYDDTFYLMDGSEITVPMMHQTESLGYTEGNGYQAVELRYDGDELSMVILLPEEGNFEAFESSLDAAMLEEIIGNIEVAKVTLSMPKFEFTSEFKLRETLETMGMVDAFSGSADFSGITNKESLFISDVIHKAFVSIDEYGTEAAAATAVIMVGSALFEPASIDINHPFIFLIRDVETGTILFLGRVLNPGA